MTDIKGININGVVYGLEDTYARTRGGLSDEAKQALLDCFAHVAWTDEHGQDYYDALEEALYPPAPPAELVSISAVYTQSGAVHDTDTLDSLKSDLVVTATYSDSTTETVTTYTLSGTLTVGTSTVTVAYGGKTTSFTVTVSECVPSDTYTVYDYIKVKSQANNTTSEQRIELKSYDDLNALSTEMWCATLTGASNNHGACFFGRRPDSNSTSSYAFYVNTDGLGYHLHGVVGGSSGALKPAFPLDQKNHIVYTNTASSPSSLQTNDNTALSIAWSNNNTISGKPTLFCNPNNYGSTHLFPYAKVGEIIIRNISGAVVSHYYPCVRIADNVIGMYESEDDVFYTAATANYATIGNTNCRYEVGDWE